MGLMRQDIKINPGTDHYARWEALSDEERRRLARKMEICAAMIGTLDVGIADVVEEAGENDSTIILFMSDNGANPKEPHFNCNLTAAEIIDKIFDNSWQKMGRVGSFISSGGGWAEACNRLLSYFKLTTAEGGVQVALIVSGTGAKRRGIVTDQPLQVIDVLPTLLDYADVERPEARNGHWLDPLYRRSWRRFLDESSQQPSRGHYNRMQGGNHRGLEDPVHGAALRRNE
jgi:arylsulfatase